MGLLRAKSFPLSGEGLKWEICQKRSIQKWRTGVHARRGRTKVKGRACLSKGA